MKRGRGPLTFERRAGAGRRRPRLLLQVPPWIRDGLDNPTAFLIARGSLLPSDVSLSHDAHQLTVLVHHRNAAHLLGDHHFAYDLDLVLWSTADGIRSHQL